MMILHRKEVKKTWRTLPAVHPLMLKLSPNETMLAELPDASRFESICRLNILALLQQQRAANRRVPIARRGLGDNSCLRRTSTGSEPRKPMESSDGWNSTDLRMSQLHGGSVNTVQCRRE